MERTVITLVALLGIFLSGCKGTPERAGVDIRRVNMPQWALSGEHPDFPSSEYIVAYGLDRRMGEAVEAAERGLEILICREAVEKHRTLLEDSHFQQVVTDPAAWLRIGEFGNAVRQDHASNGFEAVAVRAIHRDELRLRAGALLPGAESELAETMEPPGGIGNILDRIDRWGNYFLLAVRVVALELIAANTLNRTAFRKVEQSLVALWELPALIRSNELNSGQHLRLTGGVEKPLELHAWFRNRPVANVPLQWGPGAGFRGEVQGDIETNEFGRATARVSYIAPTGNDFCYVQARLDLDRAVGRRLGIAMPVWLWQVMLPSRDTGEVIFQIEENTGHDPVFIEEMKKWCTGRNFKVTDNEPSGRKEVLYHLTLEGKPEVKVSTSNDIPQAYVSGTFTLKDLETGTVLFRHTLGMKRVGQAGNTEASLAMVALREAASEILLEMAPRLIATLPGPGDEFGR